jgi:hypothetical protein
MLWSLFLFIYLFFPPQVSAAENQTIPLFYQLISAYKTPVSAPISSNSSPGQVLGTQSSPVNPATAGPTGEPTGVSSPTPKPLNIGGDGQIITIAVLGDSMIDSLSAGIPDLEISLAQYFPHKKFNIINYGVGASDLEYALYRLRNNYRYLDTVHPSLLSLKPDIIVVESFAYNNFGNTQDGFDRQWLALGAITTEIKTNLPKTKIILATTIAPLSSSFAVGSGTTYTAMEKIEKTKTIKLYQNNLINFATSQKFPLSDASTPSLNSQNEGLSELINDKDNLHPSALGSQFFCDTLAKTIFDYKLLD